MGFLSIFRMKEQTVKVSKLQHVADFIAEQGYHVADSSGVRYTEPPVSYRNYFGILRDNGCERADFVGALKTGGFSWSLEVFGDQYLHDMAYLSQAIKDEYGRDVIVLQKSGVRREMFSHNLSIQ